MMHWATRYVGIPYVDGGRDVSGLDCWGVLQLVYRERLKVDLPTYGDISARDLRRIAREIGSASDMWPWADAPVPREMDVAVMAAPGRRFPVHVGVVLRGGQLLHSEAASGCCIVQLADFSVRFRILGYRRYIA
ncbi:MAG: C40 family peptidase [Rhodobacteraceae bacterium]|nr:C40 family peptidase [Paracoccaceae bacterium]